jgi:DNA-directed RNA polymerase alpha subunit
MINDAPARVAELETLIGNWAAEKGIVHPDEMLQITMEVVKRPHVTVKLIGYMGPTDVNVIHISELDLSVRTMNCLMNANWTTVGAIRQRTLTDVLNNHGFGKKSAREISDKFLTMGIDLKWFSSEKKK